MFRIQRFQRLLVASATAALLFTPLAVRAGDGAKCPHHSDAAKAEKAEGKAGGCCADGKCCGEEASCCAKDQCAMKSDAEGKGDKAAGCCTADAKCCDSEACCAKHGEGEAAHCTDHR